MIYLMKPIRRSLPLFPSWHVGVLLLFVIIIISSTPFTPIEIGNFEITAADLKGIDKNTTKIIEIKTPWNVFNQNLNIKVVCVITSIDINQLVSLEWDCNLVDKTINQATQQKKKIVLVEIRHKNNYLYQNLSIGVNYLIAQNLRTGNYNVTDFQEHLMNEALTVEQTSNANKLVHNELFMFPNGFSSLNLTHHMMYSYIPPPDDMYTIHYMTHMTGDHDKQGWVEGKDFIYMRWIWHPKWQFGYDSCPTVYETQLMTDFYYNCTKTGIDGYFFGFMGYSGHKLVGHFEMTRNGFAFRVQYADEGSMYNLLAIPYKLSEKFNFIDNRVHPYNYVEEKGFLKYIVAAVILFILVVVIVFILKKKRILRFYVQEEKLPQVASQASELTSNKDKKSSPNKKSKNNKAASYNTFEDEMKQQPFHHSEVRSQFENKQDNFTIQ